MFVVVCFVTALTIIIPHPASLVSAESVFKPRLFELARFFPDIELPSWFKYGTGGNFEPGRRIGPIDPMEIIHLNGYPGERHKVETEDGYILELHRIPPRNSSSNPDSAAVPVLLLHGIFQSSADWMINFPVNNSFPFLLWNHGFDVWIGNHRGGPFAKLHNSYSTNSNGYWDFSMHELGVYDVPAMIDYVLNQTAKEKLHYVCFSYSCGALMAGLAIKPKYNAKLESAINLAPAVFVSHMMNGLLHYIAYPARIIEPLLDLFGAFPLVSPVLSQMLTSIIPAFCELDRIGLCINVMRFLVGNGDVVKPEQLPLITSVVPTVTGMKMAYHILQWGRHGQFAQYDYGHGRNMGIYGRETPPLYNLSKVTAPMTIYTGKSDYLGNIQDAKFLAKNLPNVVDFYEIPYENFTHIDYTYGREIVVDEVYTRIIRKFKGM